MGREIFPILRTLDWENLETRWYLTKATFLYKVLSNSAAPILKDSFTSRNILLHNYSLRNSQTDLTLPKPNREFLKRSFKYSGAYLWNNLPLEAKQAQSIYTFKSCIKQNNFFDVNNRVWLHLIIYLIWDTPSWFIP